MLGKAPISLCSKKTRCMSLTRTVGCRASGPTSNQAAPKAWASASCWSLGGRLSPLRKVVPPCQIAVRRCRAARFTYKETEKIWIELPMSFAALLKKAKLMMTSNTSNHITSNTFKKSTWPIPSWCRTIHFFNCYCDKKIWFGSLVCCIYLYFSSYISYFKLVGQKYT